MLFFFKFICLIIYSLNLALCLHLAISSFLLFNNFFGSGKSKMWIFFFKTQIAPTIERFWGTCNLWGNSYETIEWFRRIKNKSKATFIQFDIIDFYPSITKNILIDSINYARKYIDITSEQYEITLACRKTVLKNNDSTWVKNGLDNFDVPMGGYDSSQIADLVGLYILNMLARIISPQQLGLIRDDGLLYILNSNGPLSSSIQKRIIRAFKFWGFKIEISSNIKIVIFLDVTLDRSNNSYKPFIKSNQKPSYINVNSNHPKNISKFQKQ